MPLVIHNLAYDEALAQGHGDTTASLSSSPPLVADTPLSVAIIIEEEGTTTRRRLLLASCNMTLYAGKGSCSLYIPPEGAPSPPTTMSSLQQPPPHAQVILLGRSVRCTLGRNFTILPGLVSVAAYALSNATLPLSGAVYGGGDNTPLSAAMIMHVVGGVLAPGKNVWGPYAEVLVAEDVFLKPGSSLTVFEGVTLYLCEGVNILGESDTSISMYVVHLSLCANVNHGEYVHHSSRIAHMSLCSLLITA